MHFFLKSLLMSCMVVTVIYINVYSNCKEPTLRTFQYSIASTSRNFIFILLHGAEPLLPIKKNIPNHLIIVL